MHNILSKNVIKEHMTESRVIQHAPPPPTSIQLIILIKPDRLKGFVKALEKSTNRLEDTKDTKIKIQVIFFRFVKFT